MIPKVEFSNIEKLAGNNISATITMTDNRISAKIRIYYADRSRTNARYKDLSVIDLYASFDTESKVEYLTDTFLFIERHKQWILEQLNRNHI